MVVECTFGCLKVHWCALRVHLEVDEENLLQLLVTMCVLHSICETREEVFLESSFILYR